MEQKTVRQMAALTKLEVDRANKSLEEQRNRLDSEAVERLKQTENEKITPLTEQLYLHNQHFLTRSTQHIGSLPDRLKEKEKSNLIDSTESEHRMSCYTQADKLLVLLERNSDNLVDIINHIQTSPYLANDECISKVLAVWINTRTTVKYLTENELREVLDKVIVKAGKYKHLEKDEQPSRFYHIWSDLDLPNLNVYWIWVSLVAYFGYGELRNQYLLGQLENAADRPLLDIIRILNALDGLSRQTVDLWLVYARANLTIEQARETLKDVVKARQLQILPTKS